MDADLSFIQHNIHRELLGDVLRCALGDDAVAGLILTGSVARGDAYPGSDLDIYVLLHDGLSRRFLAQTRRGIVVEIGYADFALAKRKLEANPMSVYRYLDGRILYDPRGLLRRLVDIAGERFAAYEVPTEEKQHIAYGLESARVKIAAARDAGDVMKAAYVVGTISWPLLEGLWAAVGKPMPPNGAVLPHVRDLEDVTPGVEPGLRRLFLGDTNVRIEATLELVDRIMPLLRRGQGTV